MIRRGGRVFEGERLIGGRLYSLLFCVLFTFVYLFGMQILQSLDRVGKEKKMLSFKISLIGLGSVLSLFSFVGSLFII